MSPVTDLPDLRVRRRTNHGLIAGLVIGGVLLLLDIALLVYALSM